VKAIFSRLFRDDLAREETKYREISERLAGAFHERVAGQTREIIRWSGGDHVGPHGFPCRRTKPFPFYIYYDVQGDTIYFLGLVHERRHPDFLKELMAQRKWKQDE
jgi:hypothetical protein